MKKSIVLDMQNVTGENELMKTTWDDDLTLKMLERRLTCLLVNQKLSFGKLLFKQGKRYLHKKTKLHNLNDEVLKVFIEVKLEPILELETSTFGCSDCNTPYDLDYCRTINFICIKCFQFL